MLSNIGIIVLFIIVCVIIAIIAFIDFKKEITKLNDLAKKIYKDTNSK